jgi:spore maturation protein CgeB
MRHARRNAWARHCVRGDGVWFDDYPVALACAGIGLGLLSKRFPETTTTRTFEIPACGTFLLAERTADHLSLYEEGREAEFFSSTGELVEKARFYTANPALRERIAQAGRERYLRSGHTRRTRYREMLEAIGKG